MSEYQVKYYKNNKTGQEPVYEYLMNCHNKDRSKIEKYIEYLRISKGYLDEPLSRHVTGKIRELRVDFGHHRHRIFYFTFYGKNLILLHAFFKKTAKTPEKEISQALTYYFDFVNNHNKYEL